MADGHRSKTRTTPLAPRHVRPHAASLTVRQAVDSYILARTDWKPGTVPRSSDILSKFVWFVDTRRWRSMSDLTNTNVRAFLAYLNTTGPKWGSANPAAAKPLAKATKNKMGAVVRTFLRWAIAEGLITEDVIRNVKWPQHRSSPIA